MREGEIIDTPAAAGEGISAITRSIGRSASTVSREIARGTRRPKTGYRVTVAQALADKRALRPRNRVAPPRFPTGRPCRAAVAVEAQPRADQPAAAGRFPDDPCMCVSHETIYQSLHVRRREALKRELAQCLRTGRALRKPHRKTDERRSRHAGAVSISQRAAEVEDRTVPGHWEGDLITGAGTAPPSARLSSARPDSSCCAPSHDIYKEFQARNTSRVAARTRASDHMAGAAGHVRG
uniref:IS30 family transposase n=1 Tax=Nocardia exalbida TaxID=290231 RepID=UPI0012F64EA0